VIRTGFFGFVTVERGDVLRLRLVRDPQHAPAVACLLEGQAFAAVAEAVEGVVAEQPHVAGTRGSADVFHGARC